MLIMEYDPNMSKPQKRVKPLMPCSSNDCKSTRPKLAQKRDCDVSNKLSKRNSLKVMVLICLYKMNYFENRRQKKQASCSFSQSGPPLGKQKHFFLVKSA